MKQIKLLDNGRKSLSSLPTDNSVGVELKRSERPIPVTDLKATLDQQQVYLDERNACRKYRLILTINPFCSNVLFNTLTEIVRDEGSAGVENVCGTATAKKTSSEAMGIKQPNRYEMIRNTEYSAEKFGYVYHPGFDFFNNHILRNTTFKVVNMRTNESTRSVFNTLEDYQRYADGSQVTMSVRQSLSSVKTGVNKHLYQADDILSFSDSVNANLREDNGWFGFVNSSSIDTKKGGSVKDTSGAAIANMGINKPLNNRRNCEFVDMFPDRTLFSFNPKFNPYQHRAEYNWKFCITYPASKRTDHALVMSADGRVNGLLIQSVKRVDGLRGGDAVIVRTYIPHGLQRGDVVCLYAGNGDDRNYIESVNYTVTDTGDVDKKNKEYFFHITDMSFLVNVLGNDFGYNANGEWKKDVQTTNDALSQRTFRMRHLVNGKESDYYIRKFHKLPNLRRRNRDLTEDVARDPEAFEEYLTANCKKNGKMLPFNNEQYRLAFEATIYNDNSTQVTFTDSLEVEHLVDHLGRPLSELYITVVKNNQGYKKWYKIGTPDEYNREDVEYSCCFGRVSSGIDIYNDQSREDSSDAVRSKRAVLGDIHLLNELGWYGAKSLTDGEISIDDDSFDGDVAEFIPYEAREVVLTSVMHRFNTAQRELTTEQLQTMFGSDEPFGFDEIISDDNDIDGFIVEKQELQNNTYKPMGSRGSVTECDAVRRPEGYYYQPHYRIGIAELSSVRQASHFDIPVRRVVPMQCYGNMNVKVVTRNHHKLSPGDTFYICDDVMGTMYARKVISVIDTITFVFDAMEKDDKVQQMGWYDFCNVVNGTLSDKQRALRFRRKNTEIPSHAIKAGVNRYLWRDVAYNSYDDSSMEDLMFVNDHFYLHRIINFFLKRQDPHGVNGLYNPIVFPNDVVGNSLDKSSYEYVEENDIVC